MEGQQVLPVELEAWNDLVGQPTSDSLAPFLGEPDPVRRREHIRDIYHYLNARQLLLITNELAAIRARLDTPPPSRSFLSLLFAAGIGAALASGVLLYRSH